MTFHRENQFANLFAYKMNKEKTLQFDSYLNFNLAI